MLRKNSIDDVVLALAAAPIDERTGNRVLYSVDWVADKDSMIGQVNHDWVRRELDWFFSGSNKLEDMEEPVPALFKACGGTDGKVNSAYGHILFNKHAEGINPIYGSLFDRVVDTLLQEGKGTRHAVAIISDRDIHALAHYNGRNDFICTNALNFMVDSEDRLHIIAQMRSMDAVFGYRADWSMWNQLMDYLLGSLEHAYPEITRGDITFQVANLHVYPRHFQLLEDTAADTEERIARRVWEQRDSRVADAHKKPKGKSFSERHTVLSEDGVTRTLKPGYAQVKEPGQDAQEVALDQADTTPSQRLINQHKGSVQSLTGSGDVIMGSDGRDHLA